MLVLQLPVLMLSFLLMGQVQAQEAHHMTMDVLIGNIKVVKKRLVATNMTLTDAEATSF